MRVKQQRKIKAPACHQVLASFFGKLLLEIDPIAVRYGRQRLDSLLSQRRTQVSGKQGTKGVEFQKLRRTVFERLGHSFSMLAQKFSIQHSVVSIQPIPTGSCN